MSKYSVVVPVFRGENTIEELYERIESTFKTLNHDFEVLFVFDDGIMSAWEKIVLLKQKKPSKIKGIRLTRNFGQHNAIICGFKYCDGDFVITMDEDLQHAPEDLPSLILHQQSTGSDIVYGDSDERKHTSFRNVTSALMKMILHFGIPELHKDYSAFRLLRKEIADQTLNMKSSYTFLDGYLTWITTNVSSIKVGHFESKAGSSSYTINKLIHHSINIFITFSTIPIKLMTYSAFLIFFSSICYSLYILIRKLFYNDFIPGFATFMIFGGFALGVIVFYLGIIAMYLQRINMKTTYRPPFLEKEIFI